MSESDVETIRGAYDAFGSADIPGVLATMREDVVWHAPDVLPHGRHAEGHEDVAAFFGNMAETWTGFGLEIIDFVDGDDKVFVRGRATGNLGDVESGYGFVHVFHMQEGKVAHFDEYVAPPEGGFPS
jgi:ketosteroid isomerase-like protein